MNDQKVSEDEFSMITIQTQDKKLYTTFSTLKNIPYLESLYSRWKESLTSDGCIFVDAHSSLIEKLLKENTIITREYLGLEPEIKDKKKATIINLKNFDPSLLTILVDDYKVSFIYGKNNHIITFVWVRNDNNYFYYYSMRAYDNILEFTDEELVEFFKERHCK